MIFGLEGRILRMKPLKVYAGYNTDKDVRLSSSSGAVFSSLAEYHIRLSLYGIADTF